MTRETKVGLVVASSFLSLVGVVLASKLREGENLHAELATAGPPKAALRSKAAPGNNQDPPAKAPPPDGENGTKKDTKAGTPAPKLDEDEPVLKTKRLPTGTNQKEAVVSPPSAAGPAADPLLPPLPEGKDGKQPDLPPASAAVIDPDKKEPKEGQPQAKKKTPPPLEPEGGNKDGVKEDQKDLEKILAEQKKKSKEKTEEQRAGPPGPEAGVAKEAQPKKENKEDAGPPVGAVKLPESSGGLAQPVGGEKEGKKDKPEEKKVLPSNPDLPPLPDKVKPLDPGQSGTQLPRGVAVPVPPLEEKGTAKDSGGVPPLPPPSGDGSASGPEAPSPGTLPKIGALPLGTPPGAGSRPLPVPAPVAAAPARVESFDLEMHRAVPGDNFAGISQRYYHSDKYARALLQFNRDYPQGGADLRGEALALASGQTVLIPTLEVLERRYAALIPEYQPPVPTRAAAAPAHSATETSAPAVLGKPTPAPAPVLPAAAWATPTATRPYRVQAADDTLYAIAKRELGDANRWSEIYRLNPSISPELPVPANTVLRLPAAASSGRGKDRTAPTAPAAKTDLPKVGQVGYTPSSLVDGPASQ